MMIRHCLYGLWLEASQPIDGSIISSDEFPDPPATVIRYETGTTPSDLQQECVYYFSAAIASAAYDLPNVEIGQAPTGRIYRFLYADGTTFVIDSVSMTIWANWPEPYTIEDAATYLLGPILGFVLRLRGITSLHASVIAVDGKAVALVGDAGVGKSTTAAAFAMRGQPILTDDVAPVVIRDGELIVLPGYPRLRLWPDSAAILQKSPDSLPLLTPNWDKRYLDLTAPGFHFQDQPLPLGAIYLLEARQDDLTAPRFESVSPRDALIALSANTYVNYLLDKRMRAQEFDLLNTVVNRIPVRRVFPPADPAFIPALCDGILADLRALDQQATSPTMKDDSHV